MEKINRLFITLVISLFAFNVAAQSRSYKIELIVFAQNSPTSERFDQSGSAIRWPGNVRDVSSYKQGGKQLGGAYGSLKRSRDYRPLLHLSWIQGVGQNSLSRPVRIQQDGGSLDGFVRLQRGNYLHLLVDLEYAPGSAVYRLNEKRRLKLNEVHYLDHPKFGVIAKVTPL